MRKIMSFLLVLLCTLPAFAQKMQVTGTVVSAADDLPLIGVNVLEKGTTNGTITDLDGNFKLTVTNGAVIQLKYVGYKNQEVVVGTQRHFKVVMQEDTKVLDEVVVVGYGVQKKSVVTAAISRVTAKDLNATKPSRVEDALKGKVSGVQITQSSGQPGADSKVRIRGIGTINNSDPLYIVDGMAVDGGINYLNPVDIASVEILKDAASAAIYGARAANGVVLVTTKSGDGGKGGAKKATISYDFTYGVQNAWKKKEVLNAKEYMTIMNEALINDGGSPRYSQETINNYVGKGTNWQDETFNKDAPVVSHQMSISGATEKMNYYLSLGYFNQEGIVGGDYDKSDYNRWSLRTNSTYTILDEKSRKWLNKVRVGVNVGYSRSKSHGVETNSEYGSILGSALAFSPLIPVYADEATAAEILASHPYAVTDSRGRVFSIPPSGFQEIANPVAMLNMPSSTQYTDDKFVGSFWAELDIMEGLKFKTSYGVDLAFWGNDGYTFPYFLATQGKDITQSSVGSQMNRGFKWQVENVLTYKKTIDNHNFSVVLGQSAQKYTSRNLGGTDFDLLETVPGKANIDSAIADEDDSVLWGGTGGLNFSSLASYFGRVDYNYDERYIFQATVRRDGSSNFGPSHKWAIFPAFSLGWNVTNEAFMSNRPEWFNALKLRASWGKNGNENIGAFKYTALMSGGQNYYFGGGYKVADDSNSGTMQYGSSPANLSNPDVKWEESEQLDLGFEARFFNSALTFGFDYFKKDTKGMLMEQPIPSYVGQGAPTANAGDMENWGLEFELGWKDNIGGVNYYISANASYLQNKLINMGNESGEMIYETGGASGLGSYVKGKNGEVFPYFYGYKTNGLFQNDAEVAAYVNKSGELMQPKAEPGDVRFVDTNGDGKITDDDKVKIGKGMPDWTYGVTVGAEYKGFDLNLFFQGSYGNDIYDFSMRGDIPAMNRPAWILDRWIGEGTSNRIPRMTNSNPNGNWASSDLYVKDGSYLRLKTATLGYTLPKSIVSKATLQKVRLFVSGENLLTFTDYTGYDPEIASGSYTTIGIDRGGYPQARTISIGANIVF